jgi:ATP-dependent Clp protease ATP-binding subunit ClpC
MFGHFTDRARRVIVLAQEESRMLQHHNVGTEHILLGLAHQTDGIAASVLEALGVTLRSARDQVELIIGRGSHPSGGDMPFTPRAKKVLELGLREANQLGHQEVDSEHLLMGLVRDADCVGARVLTTLGVDLGQLHLQLRERLISGYETSAPPTGTDARLAAIETTLGRVLDRLAAIERRLPNA